MAGTFNPNDMELTPANVSWKPNGATAYVNLGATLGTVKVAIKTSKAHLMADQTGKTPIDSAIDGHEFTVTTEIPQTRDYQLASYLFPHATLIGSSPYNGTSPSAALEWDNKVGSRDLTVAGALLLHPQDLPASNKAYDMTFYVACPTEMSEIDYGPSKQSTWKVVWTVYPDTANPYTASGTDYRFMRRGNTTF
jgi:hypothetical protein